MIPELLGPAVPPLLDDRYEEATEHHPQRHARNYRHHGRDAQYQLSCQDVIGTSKAPPAPYRHLLSVAMDVSGQPPQQLPVWALTANVVEQRPYGLDGQQTRRGVKLFAGGAKVYVAGGFAGTGYKTVTVIGRTRHARGYTVVHLPREHLTRWRVELVYSPAAARRITEVRHGAAGGLGLRHLDPAGDSYRDALADLAQTFDRFAHHDRQSRFRRPGATVSETVMRMLRWLYGHRPV